MRPSNKRSRSKQNRPRTLGNIINRVFDSSGPEGKVRGTPQQIIDKYLVLARDAQLSGDRVAAENFSQHAEHYLRMLNEAQAEQARETDQRRDAPYPQNGQNGQQNGGQQGYAPQNNGGQGNSGPQNPPSQNRRIDPDEGSAPPVADMRSAESSQTEPRSDKSQDWKERRNRRFDERRTRRDATDPRGDQAPEAETMLVETPESRAPSAPMVEDRRPAEPAAPRPLEAPTAEASAEDAPKARSRGRPRKPRAEAAEPVAASSDVAE